MPLDAYERPIEDGMYIQYIPSEHVWKVVEDMKDETDKAVSKSLEKMGFGTLRRVVAKGEYQGRMTKTKIEKIKKSIAIIREKTTTEQT